jgi:prolyl-tRNA editing enzyme YbaK/EbsC (Cys-tRNA(Pro) deacylase)
MSVDGKSQAELSPSARRVQQALEAQGFLLQVVELPASTRTAVEAAQAVGCQVGQIVKSLIFKGKRSDRPVLVLASGANRVNEKRIEDLLTFIDTDLMHYEEIWAAAGTPNAVFHLAPGDLLRMTGGRVVDIH